jgi:hypothetical protein
MVVIYIKYLEDALSAAANSNNIYLTKIKNFEQVGYLLKTNNGTRVVNNNFNSIQWALTQTAKHLKS